MPLIERLGSFYLGKEYDLAAGQVLESPVHYDSRDLTTHAVCVGMTGSGKTGLCISLLEEAAIDNVPAIIIDPKGDMANLLLTFPDLRPEDFRPWVNLDDAGRKGLDPDEYARQIAATWRDGLADWDQGPERIRLLRESARFDVYTPGSTAGQPVSILDSFNPPDLDWAQEEEALRERIQGTVSALLGLVGVDADPLRSREHILLASILEHFWRAGEPVDLGKLIVAVQKPPLRRLGVLDLESFFPEKDRFSLATLLNNIVASPGFAAWMEGQPLDVASLLHTPQGKPRHTIFYIAHLSDAERMFFVTILLEQIITWMRRQPGTTSLRALLYMDEVFGFFPPVAEPPSKRPMLTLLKQARAFGLGCVLTTQNPVDLDYKGLSNAGTWFIGRLQTERDKARVLDGLEGALGQAGQVPARGELDRLISRLSSRVFLLHNVHQPEPVVFYTRWAMSYLRGPLTRAQIRDLVGPAPAAAAARPAASPAVAAQPAPAAPAYEHLAAQAPPLAPDVPQTYLSSVLGEREALASLGRQLGSTPANAQARLTYEPGVLGLASVRFTEARSGLDETRDIALLLLPRGPAAALSWKEALPLHLDERDLADGAEPDALFLQDVPQGADSASELKRLEKDLAEHLYQRERLQLWHNPHLKLYSRPDEEEREFRVRCQQAAREARDGAVDRLRAKYDGRLRTLAQRLERAERDLISEKNEYEARKREEVVSGLETLVGVLGIFGRRRSLSGAATKRRLTSAALADVQEAEAAIARLKADADDLKSQLETEAEELGREWQKAAEDVQEHLVRPRRTDVRVRSVSLAWVPVWELSYDDGRGRQRTTTVPAYEADH
ncbi:MAG: DUF87 domain-containing protein [Anaerolineae bacterium]|nr:DUF87 domain-containing protein [Anaerolineae bacterium]